MDRYLLTERATPDTWIDGKRVFEKTIVISPDAALPVGPQTHDLGIPELERPIEIDAWIQNLSNGNWLNLNHPGFSQAAIMNMNLSPNGLFMNLGQNGFGNLTVTLRYTKSS